MSPPISLAQSSFLLSSLLSNPPHRLDQRPLLAPRPFVLAPQVDDDEAVSTISIGQTTVSARLSTTVVRSTDHLDDGADDEGDSSGGAGIWSIDIRTSPGCQVPVSNGGNSSNTSCLELDASLQQLQHLVQAHLTSVFADRLDQFIILPSTDPARPLRGATYWNLSLDVVIHSMAGGNVYDAAWASIYAALWRARVPRTRPIAYEAAGDVDMDDVGIKSIKGKAVDYELVDVWDAGVALEGREDLGVGLTIGMVSCAPYRTRSTSKSACMLTRMPSLPHSSPTATTSSTQH